MKKAPLLLLLCMVYAGLQAQNFRHELQISWDEDLITIPSESVFARKVLHFKGAVYRSQKHGMPVYTYQIPVNGPGKLSVSLRNPVFETQELPMEKDDREYLTGTVEVNTDIKQGRGQYAGFVELLPLIKEGSRIQQLVSATIEVTFLPGGVAAPRTTAVNESKLMDGRIFKVAVGSRGIYKLDRNFFQNQLNLEVGNIDPRNIQILGNGSGPLPQLNSAPRIDDLQDNAVFFSGDQDGSFDADDFILFYAGGPHQWNFNSTTERFTRLTNPYATQQFFFIKVGSDNGARVNDIESLGSAEASVNSFIDYIRFEEDKFNILFQEDGAQGSGREFYGDLFLSERSRDFSFEFKNLRKTVPVKIETKIAARSNISSRFNVDWGAENFKSNSMSSVDLGNPLQSYANLGTVRAEKLENDDVVDLTINYPAVGDGTNKAWFDYLDINARRELIQSGNFMAFQDTQSMGVASLTYELQGDQNLVVWDITDETMPKRQITNYQNGVHRFSRNTNNELLKFISLTESANFTVPTLIGEIENQNLHGIDQADMVIIYHPDFKSQADRLALHRASLTGLKIELIPMEKIRNEFACGSNDPSGLRDFCKMLYNRDSKFRYLLLFGDATFDARDIYGLGKNFIPTYETKESFGPINAYPTDDYYGLLDPNEGENIAGGLLELGIGRIPCRNLAEATNVVNKIIHYDTSLDGLGDWRNRLVYVADDEDSNTHLKDSDKLAKSTFQAYPELNANKIYLDAYQEEATAGGSRFPLANEAINRNMFRGALVFNYFGHGGPQGWAQERVLDLQDIGAWDNFDRMPLLVTATCTFAGFDEPESTSGGELCLLNPNGGPFALFSTTRAVFANDNEKLVDSVFNTLISPPVIKQSTWTIGDTFRDGKNASNTAENARKFALLGDPSQSLKVPPLKVITTNVNGIAITEQNPAAPVDTLEALQKVTISGQVLDRDGNLNTSYNGRVFPTVYDKMRTVTTLGQGSAKISFTTQDNVVFKGQASIINGEFTFSFIVPKDIDYVIGEGRISYYAENGTPEDARGLFTGVDIGGGANSSLENDEDPVVQVFLNDTDFVDGGITDENPTLLAILSDDYGINIAGSAVGHNLTGVLDDNTAQSYVLNDFYEAKLDDYTKGEVRFPLYNLQAGRHVIEVTAWDVANNSGQGEIEFFVASSAKIALEHVLNYPNPFTTNTNFQFEHNMNDQELEVQVQIFTVSGKLVKTVQEKVVSEGNLIRGIAWDGQDDFGGQLAKGVYLYRIKVKNALSADNQLYTESDYEKLVILK